MKQENPFVDIISLDNGEVFTTHEGRVGRVLGKRRDEMAGLLYVLEIESTQAVEAMTLSKTHQRWFKKLD